MTRRSARLALVLGVIAVAAGLSLGLAPVTRNGRECGAAFAPNADNARIVELTPASDSSPLRGLAKDCIDATSWRRTTAIVTLAATVCLGGLVIVASRPARREPSTEVE